MIKNFLWTAIERVASQAINLIVQLILARVLFPEAFGLIGLIQVFIAIAQVLVEGGIGNFIIQKNKLTENDINTGYTLNIAIAVISYIILFTIAPVVSKFYEEPVINGLLKFYAVVFIIQATYIITQSLLLRKLEFRKLALINLVSALFSAIITITLALFYNSVYLLIVQQVAFHLAKATLIIYYGNNRPKLKFNASSFHAISDYSSNLLIVGIINKIFEYAYLIIIGKIFTIGEAGYYNMSRMLIGYAANTISLVIERVSLPVLSRIFHNSFENYKNKLFIFSHLSILLLTPFSIIVGLYSNAIILLFLDEKWIEAKTVMMYLGISFIMFPITITSYTIFKTNGKTKTYLTGSIISKLTVVAAIASTINASIEMLLFSQIVVNFINSVMFTILACKSLKISILEYMNNHKRLFSLIIIWFFIQLIIKEYLSLYFIIEIIVGFIIVLGLNHLFKIYNLKRLLREISNIEINYKA